MKSELTPITSSIESRPSRLMVSPGDIVIGCSEDNKDIVVPGVGSGIIVFIEDPVHRVYGLGHVVLPKVIGHLSDTDDKPAYFADRAVTAIIEGMKKAGAMPNREWEAKLVGGSQVRLSFDHGVEMTEEKLNENNPSLEKQVLLATPSLDAFGDFSNTGLRNVIAVKSELLAHGFSFFKSNVGGSKGRSLRLCPETGKVFLKFLGENEFEW